MVLSPAVRRLQSLNPLDDAALALLDAAIARPRTVPARRELLIEGAPIREAMLVIDGWAARVRNFADGRRQILNFILPGDLIGLCSHDQPVSPTSVIATTPMTVCIAPELGRSATLDAAYAMSCALDEAHLLAQITRLGRLNAYERIADLFLELLERLELAGMTENGRFAMPLTQEIVADALGLTSVHVNRMLQAARRSKQLTWSARELTLHDPAALGEEIGHAPVRVSARLKPV